MSRWTVTLDGLPPMTLNQRQHWAARARDVKAWRQRTAWECKAAQVPRLDRCEVVLRGAPPTNRRRDRHNLVPSLKAAVDGLVDAGVIPDDTPEHLVADRVEILPAHRAEGWTGWCWRLDITDASG